MPSDPAPPAGRADPPTPDALDALKQCDLVMKGGLMSGIVYPPLVLKLKDTYRFRGVGGTSAGALAAAATAAAERGRGVGGYEKLAKINEQISQEGFLQGLFQPSPSTRPLFDAAVGYISIQEKQRALEKAGGAPPAPRGSVARALAAFSRAARVLPAACSDAYKRGSWIGVFVAIGVALFMALIASSIFFIAAGLTIGWGPALAPAGYAFAVLAIGPSVALALLFTKLGGALSALNELYQTLINNVPKNNFGLCDGRRTSDHDALTDWLSRTFNDLAGLPPEGPPLTFGDLWGTRDPGAERAVDLQMVTSNLSQQQPYVVPFRRDLFIFKKSDVDALFPENVASHMVAKSRRPRGFRLPRGYFFLPSAADLPVVFAARMSMSFPILISMIPLYTMSHGAFERRAIFNSIQLNDTDRGAAEEEVVMRVRGEDGAWVEPPGAERAVAEEHLQLNWFSDGGICSNFPVHFFDAWLPTRPTFGVNLTAQLADADVGDLSVIGAAVRGRSSYSVQEALDEPFVAASRGQAEGDEAYLHEAYLPRADGDPSPAWRPIPSLAGFFAATWNTAQGFRDGMQAMLPSYRERIVQIRLTDEEDGLNLDMPEAVLRSVVSKGASAGEVLRRDFDFQRHQWVRFRVLMAQMERGFASIRGSLATARDDTSSVDYRALLGVQRRERFPYTRDEAWASEAERRLDEMGKLLDAWSRPADLFSADPRPLPEPLLRVTPEL